MGVRIDRLGAALAAALLAASGAQAQQAAPGAGARAAQEQDGILVTGQREIPPKVAQRYVRQISSSVDGQLTRFQEPVCPSVAGFAEPYNAVVERRIRKIAGEAGAELGREGCRANLIVLIAKDGDALVKDMRKKAPQLFAGVDPMDLHRAFRDGPVHMWNTTMLLNEDGQPQTGATMTVKTASILNRSTQQAIVGSMVVIDDDATLGKSLYQLADYIAMRALVGAKPPGRGIEADTIMTLFDPQVTPPPALTLVDRSYLAGVYDTHPTAPSTSAMSRVSKRIRRDAKERAQGQD